MSPALAARSAETMSEAEIRASARRRLLDLARRHGADSPQVADALDRWGRLLVDRREHEERDERLWASVCDMLMRVTS